MLSLCLIAVLALHNVNIAWKKRADVQSSETVRIDLRVELLFHDASIISSHRFGSRDIDALDSSGKSVETVPNVAVK